MELTSYVEALRHDLLAAAAAGTEQTRETARLLAAALDPSARLCLVDALSALAAEVTTAWDGGSVEIRMHGREPQVVVTAAESFASPPAPPPPPPPPGADGRADGRADDDVEDGTTSRITLRLPEALKNRAERAATTEGLSVNAWLVRAVAAAVQPAGRHTPQQVIGRRMTGYARS
ncbi:MAG: toxin-antitoxin system HicB family antitoxin [Geodermatophilaceae bacterium]|nr:toxin-antitoxin system HicB family antitoxin [Geodermatophilaceae bacterium]